MADYALSQVRTDPLQRGVLLFLGRNEARLIDFLCAYLGKRKQQVYSDIFDAGMSALFGIDLVEVQDAEMVPLPKGTILPPNTTYRQLTDMICGEPIEESSDGEG